MCQLKYFHGKNILTPKNNAVVPNYHFIKKFKRNIKVVPAKPFFEIVNIHLRKKNKEIEKAINVFFCSTPVQFYIQKMDLYFYSASLKNDVLRDVV